MQAASRTKVERQMRDGSNGTNFVLHSMKKNRQMLVEHVKQKAKENTQPVNLNTLDPKEYKIERCFKNGKLLENKRLEGYKAYHKHTFEIMKIENTDRMRNQYLQKIKDEYHSKKANQAQSRSQFQNYKNHLACLPKKSLVRIQSALDKQLNKNQNEGSNQNSKKIQIKALAESNTNTNIE